MCTNASKKEMANDIAAMMVFLLGIKTFCAATQSPDEVKTFVYSNKNEQNKK